MVIPMEHDREAYLQDCKWLLLEGLSINVFLDATCERGEACCTRTTHEGAGVRGC
jgi:hypothetical protein